MIIGKEVKISVGQIEMIENVLSYDRVLKKLFTQLIKESRDCYSRELLLWSELDKIAKEQFPEYDDEKNILSFDWIRKTLTIHSKEIRDKGLLE